MRVEGRLVEEEELEIEGQEIDKGGKPAVVALSRSYVKLGDDA